MRFSHTVFALPFALGSLVVASGGVPTPRVLLLVLFCMVTARNTAMSFNRLVDRKFDALNPRTAGRHLPAGRLLPGSVAAFAATNSALFVAGAFLLNPLAGVLSFPTLAVLSGYSLMKRFTWGSHFVLGFALGIAPSGAWIASRGELSLFPVVLGVLVVLWSAGFDIVYSTMDRDVDSSLGLKSVPERFGIRGALRMAMGLHLATIVLMFGMGEWFALGWPWRIAAVLATGAILFEHFFHKNPSLDSLNQGFFLANIAVSTVLMLGLFGAVWIAP